MHGRPKVLVNVRNLSVSDELSIKATLRSLPSAPNVAELLSVSY